MNVIDEAKKRGPKPKNLSPEELMHVDEVKAKRAELRRARNVVDGLRDRALEAEQHLRDVEAQYRVLVGAQSPPDPVNGAELIAGKL